MQRLEISGAVRPLYWSLDVKRLITYQDKLRNKKTPYSAVAFYVNILFSLITLFLLGLSYQRISQ